MLLNEFLKEHRKVELQEHKAQEQQKEIDALKAELKELKVNAFEFSPWRPVVGLVVFMDR